MMSLCRKVPLIMLLILVSGLFLQGPPGVYALPPDFPLSLSGGYAIERPNSTTYEDFLQPGKSESYKINLQNPNPFEVEYEISLKGIPGDWSVFLDNGKQFKSILLPANTDRDSTDLYVQNPSPATADIRINVSQKESYNSWEITLHIVCREGPLLVDLPGDRFIIGTSTPYNGNVLVENIGDEPLLVTLGFEGMKTSPERLRYDWTAVFERNEITVAPGSTQTVGVTIHCPENEIEGFQKITQAYADVSGITRPFRSSSITFTVSTIYDLRSRVLPMGYVRGAPGESVRFNLTLENRADETDYIRMYEESVPSGWGYFFNDTVDPTERTVSITPESKRSFHPVVVLPQNAFAGRQEVVLKAVGKTNTTVITLNVHVETVRDFSASVPPDILGGKGGIYELYLGSNEIGFTLQNMGNFFDTVSVEIDTSPSWANAKFRALQIGPPTNQKEVTGTQTVNISGSFNDRFTFAGSGLTNISVTYSAFQSASIKLIVDIPMDAPARGGIIAIIFRYGEYGKQEYFQLPVKLTLLNLEVADIDGDGISDLEQYPAPDYKVGDRIHFRFLIRNNYPYSPRDVTYKIEISGVIILEGDVGEIPPGETKEFNVSWRADMTTDLAWRAILKLESPSYPPGSQTPGAQTKEEFVIEHSEKEIFFGLITYQEGHFPWGWILLIVGIGTLVIAGFTFLYFTAQNRVRTREEMGRKEYEGIYGRKEAPRLAPSTERGSEGLEGKKEKRRLSSRKRSSLPEKGVETRKEDMPGPGTSRKSRGLDLDKPREGRKEKSEKTEGGSSGRRSKADKQGKEGRKEKSEKTDGGPAGRRSKADKQRKGSSEDLPEFEEL